MSDFESFLREGGTVPLDVASAFYINERRPCTYVPERIKTAAWEDPPEDDAHAEGLEVPLEEFVQLLGVCANKSMRLDVGAAVYSASTGENELSYWGNTTPAIVELMTDLAGPPHISDVDAPPPSTEPYPCAVRMLRAAQEFTMALQAASSAAGVHPCRAVLSRWLDDAYRTAQRYKKLAKHLGDGVVKTAMAKLSKEAPTDAELREAGRQSGVRTIAAEHYREKARRGERAGKLLGTLVGGAGGALAGHRAYGNPAASLVGAALGGTVGGRIGGELGTEVDIHRANTRSTEKAASIRKMAAIMAHMNKLAEGEEPAAPMASPTDVQELSPVNYLQAEAVGQQLQFNNEANFYRRRAQQAEQQAQQAQAQMQQQLQQMQQQLMEAQQTAGEADQKIKAALDSALQAKQDSLKQTETAARLNIASIDLRKQLLELAAQEPDMQATLDLSKTTGKANIMGQPVNMVTAPDQPGDVPDAGLNADAPMGGAPAPTQPGAAPPAGGADMNASAQGQQSVDPSMAQPSGVKAASARWALGGAAIGGGAAAARVYKGLKRDENVLSDKIKALDSAPDGYVKDRKLHNLRRRQAHDEFLKKYPARVATEDIVRGAMGGASKALRVEKALHVANALLGGAKKEAAYSPLLAAWGAEDDNA